MNGPRHNTWHRAKLAFSLVVLAATATAAHAAPGVLPPNANAYGQGYDGLAAGWLEWATSIPVPTNPILDPDGGFAAIGQAHPVWYLAGDMGGTVIRHVSVPAGNALFFPVLNYFWVNTPENGDDPWSPQQEALARSILASYIDLATNLVLQIDDRTIPNVYQYLRVPSDVGTCNLPAENFWSANAGPHPCVADGFWALLPPPSVGEHTVHFHGELEGFVLDVTYYITVFPGKGK